MSYPVQGAGDSEGLQTLGIWKLSESYILFSEMSVGSLRTHQVLHAALQCSGKVPGL